MATNIRLSRERVEQAVAQFIIERRTGALATPTEVPVLIRKGKVDKETGKFELENPDEITLPAVVISCPRAEPHAMGYPICEVHILCMNSMAGDDAADLQAGRFGLIAELFPDVDLDRLKHLSVMTGLNKPASGTDTRKVKDFTLFDFYPTDDLGEETGHTWIDHLVFDFHCVPTDDTDGDGQS